MANWNDLKLPSELRRAQVILHIVPDLKALEQKLTKEGVKSDTGTTYTLTSAEFSSLKELIGIKPSLANASRWTKWPDFRTNSFKNALPSRYQDDQKRPSELKAESYVIPINLDEQKTDLLKDEKGNSLLTKSENDVLQNQLSRFPLENFEVTEEILKKCDPQNMQQKALEAIDALNEDEAFEVHVLLDRTQPAEKGIKVFLMAPPDTLFCGLNEFLAPARSKPAKDASIPAAPAKPPQKPKKK